METDEHQMYSALIMLIFEGEHWSEVIVPDGVVKIIAHEKTFSEITICLFLRGMIHTEEAKMIREYAVRCHKGIIKVLPNKDKMETIIQKEMNTQHTKCELRLWYLQNIETPSISFFQGYEWLEKGIEEGDLELRKGCINRAFGIFCTPQDQLDWIKEGIIPTYCHSQAEDSQGHDNMEK